MDSTVRACWNMQKPFCIAVIAFVVSYFTVWIDFFVIAVLTEAIFFFFIERWGFIFETNITRLMKSHKTFMTKRQRVILLIIRTHTSQTGRMKGILCFSSFLIFLFLDKLFEFSVFGEAVLYGSIIMLNNLIISKKVKIIDFIVGNRIQDHFSHQKFRVIGFNIRIFLQLFFLLRQLLYFLLNFYNGAVQVFCFIVEDFVQVNNLKIQFFYLLLIARLFVVFPHFREFFGKQPPILKNLFLQIGDLDDVVDVLPVETAVFFS